MSEPTTNSGKVLARLLESLSDSLMDVEGLDERLDTEATRELIVTIENEVGAGRTVQDDGLPGKMIEFALDYFLPLITRDFAGQDAQDRIDARMRASHALHNEYDRLCAAPPLHDPQEPER